MKLTHVQGTVKAMTGKFDVLVNNIETVHAQALAMMTETEYKQGCEWYPIVSSRLQRRALKFDHTLEQVASAFSALSPQVSFSRNVEMLDAMLNGKPVKGLGNSIDKAKKLLHANHDFISETWAKPQKTAAFADNLYNPYSTRVTVDRHALSIAGIDAVSLHAGAYKVAEKAYQVAAKRLGMTPTALQAVTWVWWRKGAF